MCQLSLSMNILMIMIDTILLLPILHKGVGKQLMDKKKGGKNHKDKVPIQKDMLSFATSSKKFLLVNLLATRWNGL